MTIVGRKEAANGARPDLSRAGLGRLREGTYRLLSQALLYPERERVCDLATAAQELLRDDEAVAQFAFYPLWRRLCLTLMAQEQQPAAGIQNNFVRLFSAGPGGVPCPPYESVYRGTSGRPTGRLLAEVEAAYAVAGLAAAPGLGELPDHISIELEFMAILCGEEADAWEREALSAASKALKRQRGFLRRHLGGWLPAFAWQVARADSDGFYATVTSCAGAFVAYDADLVEALLSGFSVADVPPEEGLSS